jgi:D-aminopeptidase
MSATAKRNLITDIPGLRVGNAHDEKLRSGVTVLLPEDRLKAVLDVRGGGTGTRDTHALEYEGSVDEVHALVLSGGSAFGLDAATGVQGFLRERGVGYAVRDIRIPIVPQAILFDMLNGGDKDWGKRTPYQDLAYSACETAGTDFDLGSAGAGYGATTANLKGGLGSASAVTAQGHTVGALVAVNAVGTVTVGDGPHFWAAPFERGSEFGGLGPAPKPSGQATTLAIVATDVALDKIRLKRLAIMAQAGLARAIYPAHTPLDGDIVFALSTAASPGPEDPHVLAQMGSAAANVLARAVARAIFEARSFPGEPKGPPAYRELFERPR